MKRDRGATAYLVGVGFGPVIVLVVALIIATAACTLPPPPAAGRNPVIVGDSIVLGAQLQGSFTGLREAFIDADAGRGVRQPGIGTGRDAWVTIPIVLSQLATGGWLVLEIGTNDLPIADSFGTDIYPTKIADMLSQVPPNICVALVEVANWSTPQRETQSRSWNAWLRDAANKRSCARIVPWYEQTRLRTAQILQSDRVHPNAQGNNELALLIAAATR